MKRGRDVGCKVDGLANIHNDCPSTKEPIIHLYFTRDALGVASVFHLTPVLIHPCHVCNEFSSPFTSPPVPPSLSTHSLNTSTCSLSLYSCTKPRRFRAVGPRRRPLWDTVFTSRASNWQVNFKSFLTS